jgi:hypothetical protein
MQEHVTILGPQEPLVETGGLSSSLPRDLLEQIRGRVRLLALLLLVAFSFDPLIYLAVLVYLPAAGYPVIMGKAGLSLARTCA